MTKELKKINAYQLSEASGISYNKIAESFRNESGNVLTLTERKHVFKEAQKALDHLKRIYNL